MTPADVVHAEHDLSHILEPLRQFAVPVGSLNYDPKNAQTHPDRNIEAIKESFLACGQDQLLVVQKQGMIVRKGNGRLIAAKALGWEYIAAIVVEEDDVAAIMRAVADNRSSALAETDDQILAELLKYCTDNGAQAIGFTEEEQNSLFADLDRAAAEAAELTASEGDEEDTAPPGPVEEHPEDDVVPELPAEPETEEGEVLSIGRHTITCGDSRAILAAMPDNSVDAIVTDPPYEISFMGAKWDNTGIAYDKEFWAECLRVLKPGGHMVSFGACRTMHRITCAIEDSGFEIRDGLQWLFGTGFPKSLDVSKAIDKAAGHWRGRAGEPQADDSQRSFGQHYERTDKGDPITPEAQQWDGWGSAVKPAHEPITLARKPLIGTLAANVLAYGTGGLNVDGCRVGDEERFNAPAGNHGDEPASVAPVNVTGYEGQSVAGRWPPNVLLSPEVGEQLGDAAAYFPTFHYSAKASRGEREAGCEDLVKRERGEFCLQSHEGQKREHEPVGNTHPTVKPVSLMRWLCRLITPPGGTILDPFTGSGTTGIAAHREGFNFIGVERDPGHCDIIRARMEHAIDTQPEE